MNVCVTTSLRLTDDLRQQAKTIAKDLNIPYLERQKLSLTKLFLDWETVLVLSKERLSLEQSSGQSLFFHPDTAMLRIKASHDPLLNLIGNESITILDCTMGLASDSLVMASAGHEVTALESNHLIHYLVTYGLQHTQTALPKLNRAMRELVTLHSDSLTYLQAQPSKSVDIIYFDPMFSEKIAESANLSGLLGLANSSPLSKELFEQACRVARRKIILKAHFRDQTFEELGLTRVIRPNQKFHYGYLDLY
ncbi:class I SAM-dependent methyltransferase [Streptococcus caprae]|uniref:Class I SAM-dependent methyltransferase n=1 Tax=Streptococcus caprae TaxID=1640501 RepID=A0ABV8CY09_9STRE